MSAPIIPTPPSTSPRPRHIPERTCVACRHKAPQDELQRLRRNKQGQWVLGKGDGRGVYVCHKPECCQEKRLKRSFGAQAGQVSQMIATTNLMTHP